MPKRKISKNATPYEEYRRRALKAWRTKRAKSKAKGVSKAKPKGKNSRTRPHLAA